jgi:hypothetical protein
VTTQNEARKAVYEAFVAEWDDLTPYTLDNEDFDAPETGPWVRLAVRHTDAGQETLGPDGSRRFFRRASALVQVFVPINKGTFDMDAYTSAARDVFEGVRLVGTTVRFGDVVVRETGPDRERKWYQAVVEAPFQYDETK